MTVLVQYLMFVETMIDVRQTDDEPVTVGLFAIEAANARIHVTMALKPNVT